jgi:predicted Zn-dependent protease
VIWAAYFFFGYRWFNRAGQQEHETDLAFKLNAAPWSDRHVESLLAGDPTSPTLLWQYVVIASERKDWPEAVRRAEMFAARAPRSPLAWIARMDALRGAGRHEDLIAVMRQALRRLPREPDILAAWAYEAFGRKNWAEAARRFEPVRRVAPHRVDGYEVAANALIEDGRPDEADALIAEGLRQQPEAWMMWRAAALIGTRLGKLDEAICRWEAMRTQFPAEPVGFLHGAEALAQAGRSEEAVELIRQARDFFPGNKEITSAAARLIPSESEEPT